VIEFTAEITHTFVILVHRWRFPIVQYTNAVQAQQKTLRFKRNTLLRSKHVQAGGSDGQRLLAQVSRARLDKRRKAQKSQNFNFKSALSAILLKDRSQFKAICSDDRCISSARCCSAKVYENLSDFDYDKNEPSQLRCQLRCEDYISHSHSLIER
jgi:hypothetical protein